MKTQTSTSRGQIAVLDHITVITLLAHSTAYELAIMFALFLEAEAKTYSKYLIGIEVARMKKALARKRKRRTTR